MVCTKLYGFNYLYLIRIFFKMVNFTNRRVFNWSIPVESRPESNGNERILLAPELESHHWMLFSVIPRTFLLGSRVLQGMQSVYSRHQLTGRSMNKSLYALETNFRLVLSIANLWGSYLSITSHHWSTW